MVTDSSKFTSNDPQLWRTTAGPNTDGGGEDIVNPDGPQEPMADFDWTTTICSGLSSAATGLCLGIGFGLSQKVYDDMKSVLKEPVARCYTRYKPYCRKKLCFGSKDVNSDSVPVDLPTVIVDQPISGGAAKYPSLTEHYPDYNQDSSPKRKPLWHEISVIPESQRKGFLGARLFAPVHQCLGSSRVSMVGIVIGRLLERDNFEILYYLNNQERLFRWINDVLRQIELESGGTNEIAHDVEEDDEYFHDPLPLTYEDSTATTKKEE